MRYGWCAQTSKGGCSFASVAQERERGERGGQAARAAAVGAGLAGGHGLLHVVLAAGLVDARVDRAQDAGVDRGRGDHEPAAHPPHLRLQRRGQVGLVPGRPAADGARVARGGRVREAAQVAQPAWGAHVGDAAAGPGRACGRSSARPGCRACAPARRERRRGPSGRRGRTGRPRWPGAAARPAASRGRSAAAGGCSCCTQGQARSGRLLSSASSISPSRSPGEADGGSDARRQARQDAGEHEGEAAHRPHQTLARRQRRAAGGIPCETLTTAAGRPARPTRAARRAARP